MSDSTATLWRPRCPCETRAFSARNIMAAGVLHVVNGAVDRTTCVTPGDAQSPPEITEAEYNDASKRIYVRG